MKEIVKVLLAEGIDEETIHEVLNVIEENREEISDRDARREISRLRRDMTDENAKEYGEKIEHYKKFLKPSYNYKREQQELFRHQ